MRAAAAIQPSLLGAQVRRMCKTMYQNSKAAAANALNYAYVTCTLSPSHAQLPNHLLEQANLLSLSLHHIGGAAWAGKWLCGCTLAAYQSPSGVEHHLIF